MGTLCEDLYTFMVTSHAFLRMRNVSHKNGRENQNTHFMFNNVFFENCAFEEITCKVSCRVRQASDDNMAHVHCMLDTIGFKHTLRISSCYCFSPATVVACRCPSVML